MFWYELKLAGAAIARTPLLAVVTIGAIAVGIGVSMTAVTLYHTMSGNPIEYKSDRVYAVTLDAKGTDPAVTRYDRHPDYPPYQLTYDDARTLFESPLPVRKTMMYRSVGALDPQSGDVRPFRVNLRLTTADFFTLFDAPLQYGTPWNVAADRGPDPVAVISKRTNDRAFGGANSVGRTLSIDGTTFRVVGVLGSWMPRPKVYDVNNGAFELPEDVYIPFGWGEKLKMMTTGNLSCMRELAIHSFQDLLGADCVWIQFWAEFASAGDRARFQQVMDAYTSDQKRLGRFPRPLNNRLVPVNQWLVMNDVIGPEIRVILVLAVMFLAVCVLNAIGVVLAKFLRTARKSGIRRALGATRWDIFRAHMMELAVMGLAGGVAGLMLSALGLLGVRQLAVSSFLPQADRLESGQMLSSLTQLDFTMVLVGLAVAVLAGFVAGLYPAWRVCRLPPTAFLKSE